MLSQVEASQSLTACRAEIVFASSGISENVVSYLACNSFLSLTTSNRNIKALDLETGLRTIRVHNLSNNRHIQYFIKFARKCKSLLDLDMSFPCEPTDMVIQEIAGHYKHLLSIHLNTDFMNNQGVQALAQHCPLLIKIEIATAVVTYSGIYDAAVLSIAQYCGSLVCIDLDDAGVTDDGVQVLASSCHRLQYASVGGTYVTAVGALALAQRCTLARASAGMRIERMAFGLQMPRFNLCLYRLADDVDVLSLSERFPSISILG